VLPRKAVLLLVAVLNLGSAELLNTAMSRSLLNAAG
jgi:hypothetical protein